MSKEYADIILGERESKVGEILSHLRFAHPAVLARPSVMGMAEIYRLIDAKKRELDLLVSGPENLEFARKIEYVLDCLDEDYRAFKTAEKFALSVVVLMKDMLLHKDNAIDKINNRKQVIRKLEVSDLREQLANDIDFCIETVKERYSNFVLSIEEKKKAVGDDKKMSNVNANLEKLSRKCEAAIEKLNQKKKSLLAVKNDEYVIEFGVRDLENSIKQVRYQTQVAFDNISATVPAVVANASIQLLMVEHIDEIKDSLLTLDNITDCTLSEMERKKEILNRKKEQLITEMEFGHKSSLMDLNQFESFCREWVKTDDSQDSEVIQQRKNNIRIKLDAIDLVEKEIAVLDDEVKRVCLEHEKTVGDLVAKKRRLRMLLEHVDSQDDMFKQFLLMQEVSYKHDYMRTKYGEIDGEGAVGEELSEEGSGSSGTECSSGDSVGDFDEEQARIVSEDLNYMSRAVGKALILGLTQCALKNPADPIQFLAKFMKMYRCNEEYSQTKADELAALMAERERLEMIDRVKEEERQRTLDMDNYLLCLEEAEGECTGEGEDYRIKCVCHMPPFLKDEVCGEDDGMGDDGLKETSKESLGNQGKETAKDDLGDQGKGTAKDDLGDRDRETDKDGLDDQNKRMGKDSLRDQLKGKGDQDKKDTGRDLSDPLDQDVGVGDQSGGDEGAGYGKECLPRCRCREPPFLKYRPKQNIPEKNIQPEKNRVGWKTLPKTKELPRKSQASSRKGTQASIMGKDFPRESQAPSRQRTQASIKTKELPSESQSQTRKETQTSIKAEDLPRESQAPSRQGTKASIKADDHPRESQAPSRQGTQASTMAEDLPRKSQAPTRKVTQASTMAEDLPRKSQAPSRKVTQASTMAEDLPRESQAPSRKGTQASTMAENLPRKSQAPSRKVTQASTNSENLPRESQSLCKQESNNWIEAHDRTHFF